MDNFGKKCNIEYDQALGRHVVASVDIKAGETILLDEPLLILPVDEEHRCANCYKLTEHFCKSCQVFALCENCSIHSEFDCQSMVRIGKDVTLENLRHSPHIYGALKCLLLRENPKTRDLFTEFMQLEAHMEPRRDSDRWIEVTKKVVRPLLESGILAAFPTSDSPIEEELLQRFCGIIDVNSFEIRAPDVASLRSIYLRASLLAHSCIANSAIAIDEQHRLKVYANQDIKRGEIIYYCYTNVLLGTEERRHLLQMGKYFCCHCRRCEDPTELGSHLSSLLCLACAAEKRDNGFVVLQQGKWQCLNCEHTLKKEYVESLLDRTKEEMFHAKEDIYRYELLMAKLNRILHRNHYLMLDMKQNTAAILRAIIMNLGRRPGRKVYERKVRLCQEIVEVLQLLQPGISRLKAIALYELSNSAIELARLRFGEHDFTAADLLTQLKRGEGMFRESLRMLLYEPVDTPEGQLAKCMLRDLKELQNEMQALTKDQARTQ